jgi:hypothetical protein
MMKRENVQDDRRLGQPRRRKTDANVDRASHYYNCCTDGSTSPGNYGYALVFLAASCAVKDNPKKRVTSLPEM